MFTRQQVISTALGFLPMAPGYLVSHFDDVAFGFATGLCVCAVFFGEGSFFGLLVWVILWALISTAALRAAGRLLDAFSAQKKPAAVVAPVRASQPAVSRQPTGTKKSTDGNSAEQVELD
jgi:hypothetical protein